MLSGDLYGIHPYLFSAVRWVDSGDCCKLLKYDTAVIWGFIEAYLAGLADEKWYFLKQQLY